MQGLEWNEDCFHCLNWVHVLTQSWAEVTPQTLAEGWERETGCEQWKQTVEDLSHSVLREEKYPDRLPIFSSLDQSQPRSESLQTESQNVQCLKKSLDPVMQASCPSPSLRRH